MPYWVNLLVLSPIITLTMRRQWGPRMICVVNIVIHVRGWPQIINTHNWQPLGPGGMPQGGQLVSNIVNSQTVMEFYQNYNIDKFQTARCTFVCVSFGHNSNLEVTAQYFDVKTLKED